LKYGRRFVAILILMITGVGFVAFAYSIAIQSQPPSGNPCATLQSSGEWVWPDQKYYAENVTFTDVNQPVQLRGVQFVTTSFNDPTTPHLQNGRCISISPSPAYAQVKVTLPSGHEETLTLNYKGGGWVSASTTVMDSAGNPAAAIGWLPNTNFLVLLVSKS